MEKIEWSQLRETVTRLEKENEELKEKIDVVSDYVLSLCSEKPSLLLGKMAIETKISNQASEIASISLKVALKQALLDALESIKD